MQAKREFRDRDSTQVAVLDTLVDRAEEGMTVFELRSGVEVDIDELETALSELKAAELITVENRDGPMRIFPDDRVVPEFGTENEGNDSSLFDELREKLGL